MIIWYIIAFLIAIPLSAWLGGKAYWFFKERIFVKKEIKEKETYCFVCGIDDENVFKHIYGESFHEKCFLSILEDPHSFSTRTIIIASMILKNLSDNVRVRRETIENIGNNYNSIQFQKAFLADKSFSDLLKENSCSDRYGRSISKSPSPMTEIGQSESSYGN